MGGFPHIKKDGTALAGRVIQPVLKLLSDDQSEAIWVSCLSSQTVQQLLIPRITTSVVIVPNWWSFRGHLSILSQHFTNDPQALAFNSTIVLQSYLIGHNIQLLFLSSCNLFCQRSSVASLQSLFLTIITSYVLNVLRSTDHFDITNFLGKSNAIKTT